MPRYDLYDINECFQRLAMGDDDAFKMLFERYRKKVFGVAVSMLKIEVAAEEIVQEVFLSIWMARDKLSNIRDPEAYLFTITYNTIYASMKRASRDQQMLDSIVDHFSRAQNTTEEAVIAHETDQLIHDAVRLLPAQQRKVYQLSKQYGLSYDEIAERLQLSRNTVRNHLAEAMKSIRLFLKKAATMFFV